MISHTPVAPLPLLLWQEFYICYHGDADQVKVQHASRKDEAERGVGASFVIQEATYGSSLGKAIQCAAK